MSYNEAMVTIDLSIYNTRRLCVNGNGPSSQIKKKKKRKLHFPQCICFQRMLTGSEHLPYSLLPTLMLAKMVVRA